jgi:mono/diheme cytochrome c family protein
MRRWWVWLLLVIVVAGIGVAAYMLKPARGPARDLTLTADAQRGAYIIRVAGCVSCHTDKKNGGVELAGGPPLDTPFGSFVPPNITSHPDAGIGGWTIEQFSAALSDGEGPQGHLYPAFPFDAYTLMSDQDVVDLFAALKQVPPVATPAPAHSVGFPFNIRLAMAGWKNLFFKPRRFEPDPAHGEIWNRGAYLANGPGHCITCHSPRNVFGAIEAGREFTGSAAGGPGGKTPAITAAALTEKGYDKAALIEVLSTGFTPDFDVLGGPMLEEIEDSTSHWTAEDLEAVAVYLLGEEG